MGYKDTADDAKRKMRGDKVIRVLDKWYCITSNDKQGRAKISTTHSRLVV